MVISFLLWRITTLAYLLVKYVALKYILFRSDRHLKDLTVVFFNISQSVTKHLYSKNNTRYYKVLTLDNNICSEP